MLTVEVPGPPFVPLYLLVKVTGHQQPKFKVSEGKVFWKLRPYEGLRVAQYRAHD